ncbi:MAG: lysine--tRNA ligase [Chloroflexi bacterium]|nr:lysine--tRNA ligase [Chloroflexota bacterium]MCL5947366.1 lysine--tRNA ligase [Chloroflexota bacterium]
MTEEVNSTTQELEQRRAALERLKARGIDPYPHHFAPTHDAAGAAALADTPSTVTVAGRIGTIRELGRIAFTHLGDDSGTVQLMFRRDLVGDESWTMLRDLHAGDIVGASGETLRSRTGEPSIAVRQLTMLAKALEAPPEKYHGLRDVELRLRQRYLDLLANPSTRKLFRQRSQLVTIMRAYLDQHGFLEVETPILQPLYGGAAAKPFVTYHNELDQNLYLRISDELYLKRLIVGGFSKVYEIGHDFRNEGVSHRHNPEFTMMELYVAYADYTDIMRLTEDLVSTVVRDVTGSEHVEYQRHSLSFAVPWQRVSMREALAEATGIDFTAYRDADSLSTACRQRGLSVKGQTTWGKMIDELVKLYVEPALIQPTFLVDYPWELSPLAKRHRSDPLLVERFEAFAAGFEFANAFTELNDPDDQRKRFLEQQRAATAGDEEAHQLDEDYLSALRYGMPPTGGLGIGIDRLVMLITNQHAIREVILFPHLRKTDQEA